MPEPPKPPVTPVTPITPIATSTGSSLAADKVLCERCGQDMYRMHAVWRCLSCGFKTDCCGW